MILESDLPGERPSTSETPSIISMTMPGSSSSSSSSSSPSSSPSSSSSSLLSSLSTAPGDIRRHRLCIHSLSPLHCRPEIEEEVEDEEDDDAKTMIQEKRTNYNAELKRILAPISYALEQTINRTLPSAYRPWMWCIVWPETENMDITGKKGENENSVSLWPRTVNGKTDRSQLQRVASRLLANRYNHRFRSERQIEREETKKGKNTEKVGKEEEEVVVVVEEEEEKSKKEAQVKHDSAIHRKQVDIKRQGEKRGTQWRKKQTMMMKRKKKRSKSKKKKKNMGYLKLNILENILAHCWSRALFFPPTPRGLYGNRKLLTEGAVAAAAASAAVEWISHRISESSDSCAQLPQTTVTNTCQENDDKEDNTLRTERNEWKEEEQFYRAFSHHRLTPSDDFIRLGGDSLGALKACRLTHKALQQTIERLWMVITKMDVCNKTGQTMNSAAKTQMRSIAVSLGGRQNLRDEMTDDKKITHSTVLPFLDNDTGNIGGFLNPIELMNRPRLRDYARYRSS